MMEIYALFFVTIFVLLYKYATRKFNYWKKRNIFSLKPIPFFGNLLDILLKDGTLGKSMMKLCDEAGNRDFFGIFIFGRPVLCVTSPKLVKNILQKDFTNFIDRTVASNDNDPIMSSSLFFQKGSVWKENRTKLSPIFTSNKLKLMFPLIIKETEKMIDYISKLTNIPDVESKEICCKYSSNVITRCTFAVKVNSYENESDVFRQLGNKLFDFRLSNVLRQLGSFFAPDLITKLNISFLEVSVINKMTKIFSDVLRSRMDLKNLEGNDFVDILLEVQRKNDGKGLSETAMIGQVIQFFAAGFENVATILSFTIYEICINTMIQEKLRDEINELLQQNNGVMTYEMLSELKYMDMCISETLRKYPPPFLDRTCKADYKIEGTDITIEKGTPIYIPVHALHYNSNYFPNPENYDPDRFADKSKINMNGLWYLPFGDGPRICIGSRLAVMEIKIALAAILSNYRIERSLKTPISIKYQRRSLSPQSVVGIPLKFVPV